MMNRKGAIYVWLQCLTGIFIVSFLWIILSQIFVPEGMIFDQAEDWFENDSNSTAIYTHIRTVWITWPIVAILMILLWGFVASQKREYDTYQY